jgi:hypothetical protein
MVACTARGHLAADRARVRRERDDVAQRQRAAAALAQLERGGAGADGLGDDDAVAQDGRGGVGHHLRPVAVHREDREVLGERALQAQGVVGRRGALQAEVAQRPAVLERQHVRGQVARADERGRGLARGAVEVDGRRDERGGDGVGPGSDDHLVAVGRGVDRMVDPARHGGRAGARRGGGRRRRVAGGMGVRRGGAEQEERESHA